MDTKPVVLTREELSLAKHADPDYIGGIPMASLAVKEDCCEVTNGHYFIRLTAQRQSFEDFPVNPALEGVSGPNGQPILLDGKAALAALKAAPKKAHIPILSQVAVGQRNGKTVTASTDLACWNVAEVAQSDHSWPNMEKVTPEPAPDVKVGMGIRALKHVLQAAEDAGIVALGFEMHGAREPIRITGKTRDGSVKMLAVLMPYTVED